MALHAWLGVGSLRESGTGRSPNLHLTSGAFPRRRPGGRVLCSDRWAI